MSDVDLGCDGDVSLALRMPPAGGAVVVVATAEVVKRETPGGRRARGAVAGAGSVTLTGAVGRRRARVPKAAAGDGAAAGTARRRGRAAQDPLLAGEREGDAGPAPGPGPEAGAHAGAAATAGGEGGGGEQGATASHSSLRAWLRRRQALGASAQELVFELHARQGRPLGDVAELLGISLAGACEHWRALRAEMAAAAPRQEADFTMLREHLAANLWVIVEQTHPREVVMEAGVEVETALPPCPRLLALRLRALDQISKLYGVNLERAAESSGPAPYAAPGEIAQEVRRKVLALHGRDELGMECEGGDADEG